MRWNRSVLEKERRKRVKNLSTGVLESRRDHFNWLFPNKRWLLFFLLHLKRFSKREQYTERIDNDNTDKHKIPDRPRQNLFSKWPIIPCMDAPAGNLMVFVFIILEWIFVLIKCFKISKWKVVKFKFNYTRELYLNLLRQVFPYSLDRHLWKALFWSGWGGRNKDLWHVVPCGCKALQTSVTEYHQTMELHVQATSYWSCHKQVSRLSVVYWSCHSNSGIYNPFSSCVKQNWEVLNRSIECVWVIKSWSMKLGNSFTSVFSKFLIFPEPMSKFY